MTGFLQRLAQWGSAMPAVTDKAVIEAARLSFIDTIGCMVAGSRAVAVDATVTAGIVLGPGDIPVAGRSERLSPSWAALANGAAAHALDFDDSLEPALAHASAVLVPSLLATAAHCEASGEELIAAYVVGVEVMGRLGLAMNMRHYDAGWHATSTLGSVAAAAAQARLMGLDTEGMRHALSIASSMAGGSKVQFGTPTKHLHCGLAARAGVDAAMLARWGMHGAVDTATGKWGMGTLMHGNGDAAMAAALNGLGDELILFRYGLMRKLYPCCAATHRAVDGAIDLSREMTSPLTGISAIRVEMAEIHTQNLRFPSPDNVDEARFSLHYCFASALVNGRLDLGSFTPEALMRGDVRALSSRIEMVTASALHGELPPDALTPTIIEVRLDDGRTQRREITYPKGHGLNPLSEEQVHDKFSGLTIPVLGKSLSQNLLGKLDHLDELMRTADILDILRV